MNRIWGIPLPVLGTDSEAKKIANANANAFASPPQDSAPGYALEALKLRHCPRGDVPAGDQTAALNCDTP